MELRRLAAIAAVVGMLASAPITSAQVAPGASPGASGADPGAAIDLNSPAAMLRVDLDRLLAEHAFLTIEQMRSGLADAPDFAAAAEAVEGNSTDVVEAIASIYGAGAREPFGEIWRSHIGYLVDYARALGADDAAGRETALAGLADYRQDLADFLGAANPGVELAAITDALDMHTAHLITFIDRVHEGDHEGAYDIEREAYPHMFEVGDALARVIANRFPDRFTGLDVAYSAAGTLRVTLDRLLAEHAFLAAEAMRAGIASEPYFDAATAALDENAADLEELVAAAYNEEAAGAFRELWDGHDDAYVAYISADASDEAARTAARGQLTGYASDLGAFLAGANPHLDADAVAGMFDMHAQHLTEQVDAFQAGDYVTTYARVRDGYAHMFAAGEALAAGLAAQMPEKFPLRAEAPATDTAPSPGTPQAAIGLLLLASLGLVTLGIVLLARLAGARVPASRPAPGPGSSRAGGAGRGGRPDRA